MISLFGMLTSIFYGGSHRIRTLMYGATITDFELGVAEKTVTLSIFAKDAKEFADTFNDLHSIMEQDILQHSNGKLFINEQYMPCYCFAAGYHEFEEYFESTEITLRFVSGYPFWCQDASHFFHRRESEDGNIYLDYPRNYPYDYAYNHNLQTLLNGHHAPCDFEMLIYGPCATPRVYINDHQYEVETDISDGEYIVIDSRFNTVKKYDIYGNETNVFNSRNKENDLFKKISTGTNTISWAGYFGFDLTLFYERSTPKWISS